MAIWTVPPERVHGRWACFRQTSPRWPPLVHEAGAAFPQQDSGRWHRLGEAYMQYLSLSAAGAWAELLRYLSISTPDFAQEQRRNLWAVVAREHDVAQLSTFEAWTGCGLDPASAVGDHALTQALADQLRDAGYRGVLAPSAALPGAVNLSLFGERYEWQVDPGTPTPPLNPDPELWLDVELAAPEAHPPVDLIAGTCFQGQEHRGLTAYRAEIARHH